MNKSYGLKFMSTSLYLKETLYKNMIYLKPTIYTNNKQVLCKVCVYTFEMTVDDLSLA